MKTSVGVFREERGSGVRAWPGRPVSADGPTAAMRGVRGATRSAVVWCALAALLAVAGGARPVRALTACSAAEVIAQDPGCPAGTGPCTITKQFTVGALCVLDFGTRAVTIAANANGAVITAPAAQLTIMAGNLVIAPGGRINGRVTETVVGQGSTVDIEATGAVTLQKSIAGVGAIDVSATVVGGTIIINAGGTVTIAGSLNADRLSTDFPGADGGSIQISAGGDLIAQAGSLMSALGGSLSPNGGGDVNLDADGQIQLSGTIDVRGSVGGTMEATSGTLLSVGAVTANGTGDGGDGGTITLESGTSLQVTDQITANGAISPTASGGGGNGTVSLLADYGDITVQAGGGIHADGADPDGDAGEIDLTAAGAVRILKTATAVARLSVRGGGPLGNGGTFDIEPELNMQLDGTLDASGGTGGGTVTILAGADVVLNGTVSINGRAYGSGGGTADIELDTGTLTINNTIDLTSYPSCDPILGCGAGGTSTLSACSVTVTANGAVLATAPVGGSNKITASEQITISGKVWANKTTTSGTDGTNTFEFPSRKPPILAVNAVKPAAVQFADDTCTSLGQPNCLMPCPTCGNGIVEFPEQCDNDVVPAGTRPKSCDGCSVFCTFENCDDSLSCTTDSCDPVLGCLSVPVPPPCTEGPSPTPSNTPTITLTPSRTSSPSVTPTPSITPTPSVTATPTPSATFTPTAALPGGCAPTPLSGCRIPGTSVLLLKRYNTIKRVTWIWDKGDLTSIRDFGDPVAGATTYRLCIYDTSAGAPALVFGARAPAGQLSRTSRPCWHTTLTGYSYGNLDRTPEGLLKIVLHAGVVGSARVMVTGSGPNLTVPAPVGPGLLREDPSVIVQLSRSDNSLCWRSLYDAPAPYNTQTLFKDRFP
jgi:hypothetical protein